MLALFSELLRNFLYKDKPKYIILVWYASQCINEAALNAFISNEWIICYNQTSPRLTQQTFTYAFLLLIVRCNATVVYIYYGLTLASQSAPITAAVQISINPASFHYIFGHIQDLVLYIFSICLSIEQIPCLQLTINSQQTKNEFRNANQILNHTKLSYIFIMIALPVALLDESIHVSERTFIEHFSNKSFIFIQQCEGSPIP